MMQLFKLEVSAQPRNTVDDNYVELDVFQYYESGNVSNSKHIKHVLLDAGDSISIVWNFKVTDESLGSTAHLGG